MKKRTFLVGKIVRDKTPELFVQEGGGAQINTVALSHKQAIACFKKKLQEEVLEVVESSDCISMQKELADVLEVVYGFARVLDGGMQKVEQLRREKCEKKGGFETAFFVQSVTLGNDHPFIESYLENPEKYPEIT